MASRTAPSNSDEPPKVQRSSTLPTKLLGGRNVQNNDRISGTDAAVEVLFAHSSGKIVSFSPPSSSLPKTTSPPGPGPSSEEEIAGVLPWGSHTERTMAAGPIRVYRVPGSVAFLNSGKTLHPILPKSQCWCVDGETKFVLRIRGHNYYRIELPNACEEDRRAADDLKKTFSEVLQYETTVCPFKRGFHVELPEKMETPKKPWKPKHRPITSPTTLPPSSGDEGSVSHSDHESSANSVTDEDQHTEIIGRHTSNDGFQKPTEESLVSDAPTHRIEPIISAFEELKTPTFAASEEPVAPRPQLARPKATGTSLPADLLIENRDPASDLTTNNVGIRDSHFDHPQTGRSSAFVHIDKKSDTLNSGQANLTAQIELDPFVSSDCQKPTKLHGSPESNTRLDDPMASGFTARSHNMARLSLSGNRRSVTAPVILESSSQQHQDPRSLIPDNVPKYGSDETNASWPIHSAHSPPLVYDSLLTSSLSYYPDRTATDVPQIRGHKPTLSEMTIKADSLSSVASNAMATPLDDVLSQSTDNEMLSQISPTITVDGDGAKSTNSSEPSSPSSTLRRKLSKRRSHSPLPPSINLYDHRASTQGFDVTSAVLQRTASFLMTPPAFLVALMYKIAMRISNGAIRGDSSINIKSGRRIPCSWDSDEEDLTTDEEFEDDYGISLTGDTASVRPTIADRAAKKGSD